MATTQVRSTSVGCSLGSLTMLARSVARSRRTTTRSRSRSADTCRPSCRTHQPGATSPASGQCISPWAGPCRSSTGTRPASPSGGTRVRERHTFIQTDQWPVRPRLGVRAGRDRQLLKVPDARQRRQRVFHRARSKMRSRASGSPTGPRTAKRCRGSEDCARYLKHELPVEIKRLAQPDTDPSPGRNESAPSASKGAGSAIENADSQRERRQPAGAPGREGQPRTARKRVIGSE